MKCLVRPNDEFTDWGIPRDEREGVARLVEAAGILGFKVNPLDAYYAWQRYSDSLWAGWLDVGDGELTRSGAESYVDILKQYLAEEGSEHEDNDE